jgi:hypothetical protein
MPYADIETWKQAEDPEEENIAESDPLLQEAGHILTDQILLQAGLSKLVSLNWHRSIKNQLNEPNPSDD